MGIKYPWTTRATVLDLLLEGVSSLETSRRVGLSRHAVSNWAKLAGMSLCQGAVGGIASAYAEQPIVENEQEYHRLTRDQRAFVQAALSLTPPMSYAEIARQVGVHRSTISREVRAHSQRHFGESFYHAGVAHQQAVTARDRSRPGKLEHPELRREVVTRLNDKFSPQQVAADLVKHFPGREEMRVSHETIYQAIYVQGAGALRHELTVEKALRSGRTTRKPVSKLPKRGNKPWIDGARLVDRPDGAADRGVPGHWEGDLVVGPGNSGIVTLIERRSRLVLIGRLPGCRDSETVTGVLQHMIEGLPEAVFETITWDQGSEMAEHARFTVQTGCEVYFCDPHSPWQRPTNENVNGLIRDFYPKGTNFNQVTDADLANTVRLLNKRPRKVLGWDTPAERLCKDINAVALTI